MKSKKESIQFLWQDLAENLEVERCIRKRNGNRINVGFINQFAKHKFIPNLWFDWERKVNAPIMVVGQDWGPYTELKKLIDSFKLKNRIDGFDYDKFLLETFSSRTEDFIKDVVIETYKNTINKDPDISVWDDFIFTVAVFFTRRGNHFRGNKYFDERFGLEMSQPYLEKQIKIVDPKVIMVLGGTAWRSIRDIFELEKYPQQISKVIESMKHETIEKKSKVIIPAFHPACHVTKEEKVKPWRNVWRYK